MQVLQNGRLAGNSYEKVSANPILDLQPAYPLKLSFVVGYQRKFGRFGVRSNPQIVVSDGKVLGTAMKLCVSN